MAKVVMNGKETGNGWKKGQSGNPKGRPKSLLSNVLADLKAEGYEGGTRAELAELASILVNIEEERLKTLIQDKKIGIVSRAIMAVAGKSSSDLNNLKFILELAHGKDATPSANIAFEFKTNTATDNFLTDTNTNTDADIEN
jgi:Family of unknown function (DUF5681)